MTIKGIHATGLNGQLCEAHTIGSCTSRAMYYDYEGAGYLCTGHKVELERDRASEARYRDQHGRPIKAGDKLIYVIDGTVEEVFACGDDDLGVNASNPDYLAANPNAPEECYPLHQFDLRDWRVLRKGEEA